jgi:3D (Asp-Asp-Asp) domain-containing protein
MWGFTVTAYTPFPCCNGQYGDKVATGRKMRYYTDRGLRIMAVDTRVIPLYSCIIYKGKEYFALDRGGMIKGKRLDLHIPIYTSEKAALKVANKFGVKRDQKIKILVEIKSRSRFLKRMRARRLGAE